MSRKGGISMSTIRSLTRAIFKDERQYEVYGEVIFKFRKLFDDERSSPPELREKLLRWIRLTDSLYPWKDYGYINPSDNKESLLPSIGDVFFMDDQYNNWEVPELNVWFRIRPTSARLRRSQIYAYERYLETLCEETAKITELMGVATIRCICRFNKASAEFRG